MKKGIRQLRESRNNLQKPKKHMKMKLNKKNRKNYYRRRNWTMKQKQQQLKQLKIPHKLKCSVQLMMLLLQLIWQKWKQIFRPI